MTGGQHVHRHRRGDRAHIQDPRPDRPPAMQRQRNPQGREDQRCHIRDTRLDRGDRRDGLGGEHHPVLRRVTHHRRRAGQDTQGGHRRGQPPRRTVDSPAAAQPEIDAPDAITTGRHIRKVLARHSDGAPVVAAGCHLRSSDSPML